MRQRGRESLCALGQSLVSQTSWPSLATGGCPEQTCHLAPGTMAFPYSLCLLTHPPGLQGGQSVGRKIPQERDLGFSLNCQCHENLGENVRCLAPGRTVKRRKHNRDAGQGEASVLCRLCFLPSNENSFLLSSALFESRTDAAPRGKTRAVLFSPFFPRPRPNDLPERLAQGF